MSDKILVSTRKGLFTVSRNGRPWEITGADFLGDNVTLTLTDPRDGRHYAALDHGHFGVKLHRSTANGQRGRKRQPSGGASRLGGAPSMVASLALRPRSSRGTAVKRPRE